MLYLVERQANNDYGGVIYLFDKKELDKITWNDNLVSNHVKDINDDRHWFMIDEETEDLFIDGYEVTNFAACEEKYADWKRAIGVNGLIGPGGSR